MTHEAPSRRAFLERSAITQAARFLRLFVAALAVQVPTLGTSITADVARSAAIGAAEVAYRQFRKPVTAK